MKYHSTLNMVETAMMAHHVIAVDIDLAIAESLRSTYQCP
jgi:hypothetical protein